MVNHTLRTAGISLVCGLVASGIAVTQADAQDDANKGIYFTGELSTVSTFGNSESLTLGVGTTLGHLWETSELKFEAGGVRTESSIKTRTATGTTQSFAVQDLKRTEKTAEAYYLRGRYDRNVSANFFVFGGADWLRNTFAGIDSRTLLAAGAGNMWVKTETTRFKTDVGFTYTFQDDVFENPLNKMNFPGIRLGYDLRSTLSASTNFESSLVGDWNLDNTDDVRLNLLNSVSVAISSMLALKPALKLQWQNAPSSTQVPLFDNGGVDTGQTVLVPLQKLDSIFTLSLVLKL
jgi:putative salt-induced outer membrane protein YdiY